MAAVAVCLRHDTEKDPVDDLVHVLLIAIGELEEGLGVVVGRFAETLAVSIFAWSLVQDAKNRAASDGRLRLMLRLRHYC